ncbi:MAG: YitT family protein [Clostridia bacterium]|nr:YitT family protein [Clostridia bacterium]MBQ5798971.1 YitT family protein [Clostridia bacterium]
MGKSVKILVEYAIIIAMALLQSVNYHFFIIENNFAPAGLNGVLTMLQYKTGISLSYTTLIVCMPLCVLLFFFVSRKYAVRSAVFTLVNSFSYLYLQYLGLDSFKYDAGGHDTVFPAIISGVLAGVISGLCFANHSASGGMEMVSKYISKLKPNTNFFVVSFVLNAIVAIVSLFVYSDKGFLDYKPVALCITYCFVSSAVGNYILKGSKTAYKFTIITTHADEISKDIMHVLRHGATKISATGAYTGTEKNVLICVVNKHQLTDFKKIVDKYDETFSFYELVNETYGNFKHVKH